MSSKKKDGHSDGNFHQEYIASLRYRNDLPPPEMPPKFLEVPHDGLDRFLRPGFASNMMRREEPNIDIDAEGGMPIDPVGIPGLHLGDDSGMRPPPLRWREHASYTDTHDRKAILAPEHAPAIDPADMPLLMTLEQLRNPAPKNANVSFLRRTQYITPTGAKMLGANSSLVTKGPAAAPAKRKPARDDPLYIKKYIMKGFDIAHPESQHMQADSETNIRGLPATESEIAAWTNPKHPTNPRARPIGFFPVLPDLTGFNDTSGYVQLKFEKPPVPPVAGGASDDRMDVAIVVPSNPDESVIQEYESRKALHESNPKLYADPGPQVPLDYDVYLPEGQGSTQRIKDALNMSNPYRDDEDNYTHERENGLRSFRYNHLRTHSTSKMEYTAKDRQMKDLALVLFDPEAAQASGAASSSAIPHRLTHKGAYYLPILTRSRIRPERAIAFSQAGLARSREKKNDSVADQLHLRLRDPNAQEIARRAEHRALVDSAFTAPTEEELRDLPHGEPHDEPHDESHDELFDDDDDDDDGGDGGDGGDDDGGDGGAERAAGTHSDADDRPDHESDAARRSARGETGGPAQAVASDDEMHE
ncbi:hypothetical protein KEM52_002202 [Ascosphaera acerosa]|nr:hypothetical protein KEM52_002202 [Ascosphaera acerosa]